MREYFRYVNSENTEVVFGSQKILANENDLRNYTRSYSDTNGIGNFKFGKVTKNLPIILVNCTSEEKNHLYETFLYDIERDVAGKIYIGDYYMNCFIYESKSSEYTSPSHINMTLKVVSEDGIWHKEESTLFLFDAEDDDSEDDYRGYDYGYDYGYGRPNANSEVVNDFGHDCSFKLIIYGPCENPTIAIGGHYYKVNKTLLANEHLIITSTYTDKTIFLTQNNGTQVNCFADRNKESYVFQKIPKGVNNVVWDSSFQFEVILIDERGEPAWK